MKIEMGKVNYREWVRTLIAAKGEDAWERIAEALERLEGLRSEARELASQAVMIYEKMK